MSYLRMESITKIYEKKGLLALDDVSLEVKENEFHAIIGENAAGKSTLMKILYGLEKPQAGRIFFKNREIKNYTPMDASRLGIGMVHQHFKLVPDFSIAENVVLGAEPVKGGIFFDKKKAIEEVQQCIDHYGFHLHAGDKVKHLTVGQMQQVEILKILYRKVDLLILDEPAVLLPEQEVHTFFSRLKELQEKEGKTLIFITHKLREIMQIASRITVMRKGKAIAVLDAKTTNEEELTKLMVGTPFLFYLKKEKIDPANVILELKDICLYDRTRKYCLLDNVSIKVHEGEIAGVTGLSGNGLAELEDVVAGIRPPTSGQILYNNTLLKKFDIAELRQGRLAYVPADRIKRGSSTRSSIHSNLIISRRHTFSSFGVFNMEHIDRFVTSLIKEYSITGHKNSPVATLSGGNIQKVILARELSVNPNFIIFCEPTWGLDVASSRFIYEEILKLRKKMVAILLISSDMDEIMNLCDSIVVLYRGKKVFAQKNSREITKTMIGEYMLGLKDDFNSENNQETKDSLP
ncbi:MAG: ABC transporter ATP-binding protein [Spirochaetales bacterium]|nr:ABC transporter ATP-binding protein [Spirochaetales bacterium]